VLDNKYDTNQWEEWNHPPLTISAEDAWKEMEKLLDEESSDMIPVPVLPLENEKEKRKRFAFWWIVLVGIVLLGTILIIKKEESVKFKNSTTQHNNKTINEKSHIEKQSETTSKKIVVEDRKVTTTPQEATHAAVQSIIKSVKIHTYKVYTLKNDPISIEHNDKIQTEKNNLVKKSIAKSSLINGIPVNKEEKPLDSLQPDNQSLAVNINTLLVKGNKVVKTLHVTNLSSQLPTTKNNTEKNKVSFVVNDKASNNTIQYNKATQKSIEPKSINADPQNNNTPSDRISTDSLGVNLINSDSITTKTIVYTGSDSSKLAITNDSTKTKKESKPIKKITVKGLSAGLQWSASLPMTDNNSNTTKQLIPGVWFSKTWGNKSAVSLSVNPFVMQTNSRFVIENKIQSIGALASTIKLDSGWYSYDSATAQLKLDTNIKVNRVATLLQSFGYRVAVDYQYQFARKWQVSLGAEYNKIVSAYINDKIIRVSDGLVAKDSTADIKTGNELWNLIQHSYFSGNLAITYSPLDKLSISVGFHKPFKSIANDTSQSISPSSYFLNVRWLFWKSKK